MNIKIFLSIPWNSAVPGEDNLFIRLESEKETSSVAEGEVYIQLSNQANNQPLSSQVSQ